MHLVVYQSQTLLKGALVNFLPMLYVKPVPDVDILFTFVSVFSLIFLLSTSFW